MSKPSKKYYPLVSICTPTFNRRPFIPTMFQCFKNQTYPKNRMEWIIVDDGPDKIQDLVDKSGIQQIRYIPVAEKMTLGAKRNYMHSFVKGSFIVYMDDDDYYPPERVEHAVDTLLANPHAMCAGSSEIYLYFKHIQKMYQAGPYSPSHSTAGTFAFRKELLNETKYEETAALAEEKAFLKDYTVPFVQLDPVKTILVFSHEHNTFDKRKLLEMQNEHVFKESPKTVEMFIKNSWEADIKQFFMVDIDQLLLNYEPGLPKMKPDVLKQITEIEETRRQMQQQQQKQQQIELNKPLMPGMMLQQEGQPPREMTVQDALNILNHQKQQIDAQTAEITMLKNRILEMEKTAKQSQLQLLEKSKTIADLKKGANTPLAKGGSKSEPEIRITL
jgi:glycosyltransferase involved in cell wall biosynthesis